MVKHFGNAFGLSLSIWVTAWGLGDGAAALAEVLKEPALDEQPTLLAQSLEDLPATYVDDFTQEGMEQVTSVSQLTDVQPTDWAFQALQSLVERYGCIEGYPDRTYRGNRAMTRYEFAAGLNACLERINEVINTIESISSADLETLRRLQSEFGAELAELPRQLDVLEARLNRIDEQRFSTTTVFNGEVLFAVSAVGGEDINGDRIDINSFLSHRAELNFSTSFFGPDLLRLRLAAANTPDLAEVTGTNFARLSFTGDTNNDIRLGAAFYRFPIGQRAFAIIGPQGVGFGDFAPTLNPYINSSLLGNVGGFSGESAIYGLQGGRGVGLEYRFNRAVQLSLGYLPSQLPNPQAGLFKGPYGAIAQLTLYPSPSVSLGLTYIHTYNIVATGRGSRFAEDPFNGAATSTNAYGLQGTYQVTPRFNVSGWVGLINAHAESNPHQGSDASILTWATTFAFPDLGRTGNLAGLIVGQPPKAIRNDVIGREDRDTSLHFEAFYRYAVTPNISITPGFFIVTHPEHNSDNSLIYVGTIRTSFAF